MNDHWLKDHFKDTSTEVLELKLWQLEIFSGSDAMIKMIRSELERRKSSYESNPAR